MGSSVKLVTKDELTTGNYFNADNLIGGENTTIVKDGNVYKINTSATVSYPHIADSDKVTISVNGSSDTFAFTANNISSLNTLIANRESYLTQNVADGRYANKTELNYKQDQLTPDNAGNNITITGSGSTLKINAEATASYPHISDSDNVTISAEGTSDTFNFTSGNISSLNTLVSNSGNYLTLSAADARYAKTTDLSNKQDQLTPDNAGDNITITGSGSTLKINATTSANLKFYSEGESSAKIETNYSSFEIGDNGTRLSSASELNISSALGTYLFANRVTIGNTDILFTFDQDSIQALNRHIGKDFVHLTRADWGTMEDGGVYYVDMISDSGPFNFQTGLSMAEANGKVYTAELHIHYNENIDSPVWPNTWQWVDEDDVTQPTPVPSGSNGKWICYTVRSVNGFTLVHMDHIYGTAS